jgi:hypothetical protein
VIKRKQLLEIHEILILSLDINLNIETKDKIIKEED